jgi:hypothetical protein
MFLPSFKKRSEKFITNLLAYRLLPPSMYTDEPRPPSLMYGLVHLLRLLGEPDFFTIFYMYWIDVSLNCVCILFKVKIPGILTRSAIPERRLNVVVKHTNLLIKWVLQKVCQPSLDAPAYLYDQEVLHHIICDFPLVTWQSEEDMEITCICPRKWRWKWKWKNHHGNGRRASRAGARERRRFNEIKSYRT